VKSYYNRVGLFLLKVSTLKEEIFQSPHMSKKFWQHACNKEIASISTRKGISRLRLIIQALNIFWSNEPLLKSNKSGRLKCRVSILMPFAKRERTTL
jgi:hypothetical protein